jgi:hypothetical protein
MLKCNYSDLKKLFIFILFALSLQTAFASLLTERLITWTIPTHSTAISLGATSQAAGVTSGSLLSMGTHLTPSSSHEGWGGSNWTVGGTGLLANNSGNYFAFSITPTIGHNISVTGMQGLVMLTDTNGKGPQHWDLLYSNNSSFANFSTYATFDMAANHTLDTTSAATTALANDPISIESGTTGYFRMVGYGAQTTNDHGLISSSSSNPSNFGLMGTVSSVPEPSSLSLLALGGLMIASRRLLKRPS